MASDFTIDINDQRIAASSSLRYDYPWPKEGVRRNIGVSLGLVKIGFEKG